MKIGYAVTVLLFCVTPKSSPFVSAEMESSTTSGLVDRNTISAEFGHNPERKNVRNSPAFSQRYLKDKEYVDCWMQIGDDIVGDGPEDGFGTSISMTADGKTIVVTSPFVYYRAGRTRVFRYNSSAVAWEKLGQDLYGERPGDFSGVGQGVSIASNGDIIAIGARDNDGTDIDSGHVRTYRYDSITLLWKQMGDNLDGEKPGDGFGNGVALSQDGSYLVVGAPNNNDEGIRSGQVKVFRYASVSEGWQDWQQVGPTIRGTRDDEFGRVVSISSDGMIIAASAPHVADALLTGSKTGRVRVFQYSTLKNDWEQMGGDILGEAATDWFGAAISMTPSGNIIAIGAPFNDGNGEDSGTVTVYEYNAEDNDWVQFGDILGQNSKDSLWSVALSSDGKTIVVGSRYNSDGGLFWRGNARIFQHSSSTNLWNQIGGDIQGPNAYAMSGKPVSISSDGSTVAVSTSNAADGFFSAVRVFIRDSCSAPSSIPSSFPTESPSFSPSVPAPSSTPSRFPIKSKKTKAPKSKKDKHSPRKTPKTKKNTKAPKTNKNTKVPKANKNQ